MKESPEIMQSLWSWWVTVAVWSTIEASLTTFFPNIKNKTLTPRSLKLKLLKSVNREHRWSIQFLPLIQGRSMAAGQAKSFKHPAASSGRCHVVPRPDQKHTFSMFWACQSSWSDLERFIIRCLKHVKWRLSFNMSVWPLVLLSSFLLFVRAADLVPHTLQRKLISVSEFVTSDEIKSSVFQPSFLFSALLLTLHQSSPSTWLH